MKSSLRAHCMNVRIQYKLIKVRHQQLNIMMFMRKHNAHV